MTISSSEMLAINLIIFRLMRMLRLLVLLVCFSNQINAQVLWYGDPNKPLNDVFYRFDSGNYPGDICPGGDGTAVSTAGTTIDPVYGKVWTVNKPQKRKRGEFARTSYVPAENQTLYYGWRWKIQSTPRLTSGIAVFQWKTEGDGQNANTQNYPLNLGYANEVLSLNIYGPCYPETSSCGGSINDGKITLWTKPVKEGEWVTIVIKLKLSRDKNVGEVEFWFNGMQQTFSNNPAKRYSINLSADKKIAYHKTFDGYVTYPKWGAYNSASCSFEVKTFYDQMRIGATLDDVLNPLLLTQPPTSTANIQSEKQKVYPNPSKDGFFYLAKAIDYTVYSLQGLNIVSANDNKIDLSNYPKGVYFVKIDSDYNKLLRN